MGQQEIDAMTSAITDMMTVLRHADPAGKAELYTRLGLRLTCNPGPRTINARTENRRSCTKGPR
jgi:hypothetical protein